MRKRGRKQTDTAVKSERRRVNCTDAKAERRQFRQLRKRNGESRVSTVTMGRESDGGADVAAEAVAAAD